MPDLRPDEYDRFRDACLELGGEDGIFDANDATAVFMGMRFQERGMEVVLGNVTDVLGLLRDMVDLGYLEEVDRVGNGPARWQVISQVPQ